MKHINQEGKMSPVCDRMGLDDPRIRQGSCLNQRQPGGNNEKICFPEDTGNLDREL